MLYGRSAKLRLSAKNALRKAYCLPQGYNLIFIVLHISKVAESLSPL